MSRMLMATVLLTLFTAALIRGPAPSISMTAYKWKNRPLLVFTPSAKAQYLDQQKAIVVANQIGFRERDMVVIYVTGDYVSAALGRGPGRSAQALRADYGIKSDQFLAILVGKDGDTKLRSSKPVSAARLFSLIDPMPMRQQEMREQG